MTADNQPKFKFPKTLGACADRVYQLREKRYAAQKTVDLIQAEETALKEHLINTLPKSEATGAAGKLARVTSVTKDVPQVEDWDLFYKYVKRTGEFDLLQRRLATTAVEARLDVKKKVPGVKLFRAVTLSITKV